MRILLRDHRGQGLIEYLILVALVAVGSLAVVRVLGANISTQYAKISKALGAQVDGDLQTKSVSESMYKKRDLSNFLQGAVGGSRGGGSGSDSSSGSDFGATGP